MVLPFVLQRRLWRRVENEDATGRKTRAWSYSNVWWQESREARRGSEAKGIKMLQSAVPKRGERKQFRWSR